MTLKKEVESVKKVIVTDDDYGIRAERLRASDGTCHIMLTIGDFFLEFNSEEYGDKYAYAAISAAECLNVAAHDPCLLDGKDE